MKETSKQFPKTSVSVVSTTEMASDRRARFQAAASAVLADLLRNLDRQNMGETDGKPEQVDGQTRNRRLAPKR